MYTLTKAQKLENLKETLILKRKKLQNLQDEVELLEKKISKFEKMDSKETQVETSDQKIRTSTDLSLIPVSTRDQYIYDPGAPTFEEINHM